MDPIYKAKALAKAEIDIEKDIEAINQHSIKTLTPEDVYAFSVILCDNEIDRDFERFSDSCLEELVPLFLGKTGIFNHSWSAKDQVARIYRVATEDGGRKTAAGDQLRQLLASAYIPRTESTAGIIELIESGIHKEVSVGVSIGKSACSVCGSDMRWGECTEGHRRGLKYEDGGLCYGILSEPSDAYEFSFVAVPAQRGAGVTKGFEAQDFITQWNAFMGAWDGVRLELGDEAKTKLLRDLKSHFITTEEQQKRQKIIETNQKFIKKEVND